MESVLRSTVWSSKVIDFVHRPDIFSILLRISFSEGLSLWSMKLLIA